jgi:hypothetical protein
MEEENIGHFDRFSIVWMKYNLLQIEWERIQREKN